MTARTLTLRLTGSPIDKPPMPALLRTGTARAAAGVVDPFLPGDYLRVVEAFDLSPTGRSAPTSVRDLDVAVQPGQVLVLELPDGTTLITSGERLEDELQRIAPEALAQGTVALDAVQPRGAASRGLLDSLGRLVAKVFVLDRGGAADAIIDDALAEVRRLAGDALADKLRDGAYWGIDYLATRALMWAVERQLLRAPGLYRWVGAQKDAADLFSIDDPKLAQAAQQGPLLVFIHGTASYTTGSFGDLRSAAPDAQRDWDQLEARYGERIFGFEHRTFSESPIENALLLARTLPAGAHVDLVTHSRGGIVGDLLCLDCGDLERTRELIDGYRRFRTPDNADAKDLDEADARDRRDLLALTAELRAKRFAVGRYVRVAAPVNGTLLAGSNLDLFLSSLLTLFGVVTTLQASPFYMALKRLVLEIARNRADANRVPGLEAMLPGSAISRLLRLASPQKHLQLGVVAGDIEGATRFKRLVEFLADWAIFERTDNDLVVDTASMDTGIARGDNARRLFVQGPGVSHFAYFGNGDSRAALTAWLTKTDPATVPWFEPLPGTFEERRGSPQAAAARAGEVPQPVVIVVPGVMGSHLQLGGDRIWFDPLDIARGRLQRLAYSDDSLASVGPDGLFDLFYGDLCRHLGQTHRVVRYPYDWRRPVQHAAGGLARELRAALASTKDAGLPVRILAHSMGGLVTRALAAAEPQLWDEFLARDGARFVMLGTPNRGSHLMVENLVGKGDMVRKLAMLDQRQDLQQVLDLVAGFRGALQLLPSPGFADGGAVAGDYYEPRVWQDLKPLVFDFWFGNGRVAIPEPDALAEARTLWAQAGFAGPSPGVPGPHPDKVIYVCGKAANTPCGVEIRGGRAKMLGTPEGDGSVSWASGRIEGIGKCYLMDAAHGDLAASEDYFDGLTQLLTDGETDPKLMRPGWPMATLRGEAAPPAIVYDVGPAAVPTDEQLARSLLGASGAVRAPRRRRGGAAVLGVTCAAMDLRFARDPVLVGHYEQDPIAGAEATLDRDVVGGELTMRKHLGLYPGPVGTATVVLVPPNAHELALQQQRGVVVAGLGAFGELTAASLTEAVRAAALRYLLAMVERRGAVCGQVAPDEPPIEVGIASLLLGFNSTSNIGVSDSVNAIVRGTLEANRQFAQAQRGGLQARIVRLEIVECYLDVAVSAAKALQGVAAALEAEAAHYGMRVDAHETLVQRQGVRPRLEAMTRMGYWPRMIVTAADDERALEAAPGPVPPGTTPVPASRRARVAEKLRYVYLAQRARAETEVLQRQPGLIEKLVSLSVDQPGYQRDLSRTLFQLMVPLDFKEAARQTETLSMLVDDYTANFPWELLCADDEPMVARTAMVRQFVTTAWRRVVRSTVDRTAYIVGNPSTEGFAKAFPNKANRGAVDPKPLPGAEEEAYTVSRVLRAAGYEPAESIGVDQRAVDVINRLFQRPYRIVHVAAHGEFDIEAADGTRRSGVLLSDGLMLTAAEIGQMEFVPDVVFLNCCHLGQVDGRPTGRGVEFNRLASSLARELIDMGVPAVVVAGWAVDDRAGQTFAEAFYRYLIHEGRTFGMAVHQARLDTYREHRSSNTWGAFQAYGAPDFLIDPTQPGRGRSRSTDRFVAPQELIDDLEAMREELRLPGGRGPRHTLRSLQRAIKALLDRGPKGASWTERADVQFALAMLYAELGPEGYETAVDCLLKAMEADDPAVQVPIQAIELLGNLEARLGVGRQAAALIEQAGERLQLLARAVAAVPGAPSSQPTAPERCGLLGSAWKRRAAGLADGGRPFRVELEAARDWYRRGEGQPDTPKFSPYCALNRVVLDALLGQRPDPTIARAAAAAARAAFLRLREYWYAMMPADARLAQAMCEGTLDDPRRASAEVEAVVTAYREARSAAMEDVKSWDSVVGHIELLRLFADRLGRAVLADSLAEVVRRLRGDDGAGMLRDDGGGGGPGGGAGPEGTRTARRPERRQAGAESPSGPRVAAGAAAAPRSGPGAAAPRAVASADGFSRFFTLAELVRSETAEREGIANQPGDAEVANLRALCAAVLDPLREAIGRPIKVNSGYRGPALNRRIGGSPTSQHAQGRAADIQAPGMPVLDLFQAVIRLALPFDQLIYEARSATAKWVHVSHNPGANRGEIRVAEFDASGRPVRYPQISAQRALAMSEPASRSAGGEEAAASHVEVADEPTRGRRSRASAAAGVAPAARQSGTRARTRR